jgi:hypothetical protein
MNEPKTLEEWIASRPPSVQKLAREFPISTTFSVDGTILYVIGYDEGGLIILTHIDPAVDYDTAFENRVYIHADCLREALK